MRASRIQYTTATIGAYVSTATPARSEEKEQNVAAGDATMSVDKSNWPDAATIWERLGKLKAMDMVSRRANPSPPSPTACSFASCQPIGSRLLEIPKETL